MCRLLAYKGPAVPLDELLFRPNHSIVRQSTQVFEHDEPLNGDGWGVGWYEPDRGPWPARYRSTNPAWSDDNLKLVAPLVRAPLFMAHLRAASFDTRVNQINCHPFRGGLPDDRRWDDVPPVERGRRRLLFMHNGEVKGLDPVVRHLHRALEDDLFFAIQGNTDTEHLFVLFQQVLGERARDPTAGDLGEALVETLDRLQALKREAGTQATETTANTVLTDGRSMVASRFTRGKEHPPWLYVAEADAFTLEKGEVRARDPEGEGAVIVASEPLWDQDGLWREVPEDHLVTVSPESAVEVEPIEVDR